jgi:serine/threonine protein kinase/tetratricopeptide (TPR) repeat protein
MHPNADVKSIFGKALECRSAEARAAYLAEACGGDAALRAEVEGLLQALDGAAGFMSPPARVATEDYVPREPLGSMIGPYRLMEEIGEGGMGLVYVAEQQHPVRRKVALKLIKPGMDTRQVVARFEAERQALALMDHPNIAKILDAGATDKGRPFFVMELVRGVPITTFCDESCLTPRERLELFVPVCQAVQHAHQKGILHRDLKPSNILVTLHDGRPVPKVIDFGVAKAIGQQLTEKTIYTGFAQMIGTPAYMSPEQAEMSGLDVDTRADVYALGVLLYELLTGATPFDKDRLRKAALDEVRRIIKEEEPPPPSTRISTSQALASISAQRKTEPTKLSRVVKGELDWIVMRCLEKDRSRRYESANGLARDVQRYLADEAVEACPPSPGYRLRKFARKHRTALAAATAFVLLLMLLAVVSLWSVTRLRVAYAIAEEQRRLAEEQRDEAALQRELADQQSEKARKSAEAAQRVSDFLLHDLLSSLGPVGSRARMVSAEQLLDRAAKGIGKAFSKDPAMEATARATISWTYRGLGYYDAAEREIRAALKIRRRALGEGHPDTLESLTALGAILCHKGQFAEAEKVLRPALEAQRRLLGDDHTQVMWSLERLAWALKGQGKAAEAAPLNEEALRICRRRFGEESDQTLHLRFARADSLNKLGRRDDAVAEYRDVLKAQRRLLGEGHPNTLGTMRELAVLLWKGREFAEAEALLRNALEVARRTRGGDHPWTLDVTRHLARLLRDTGRFAEAATLAEEVLRVQRRSLGEEDEKVVEMKFDLGLYLFRAGKAAEAEPHLRQVVAARRRKLPAGDPGIAHPLALLGVDLFVQNKHAEAEAALREAIAALEKVKRDDDPFFPLNQGTLGACLLAQKKYEQAEPFLRAAWDGLEADRKKRPEEYKPGSFWHGCRLAVIGALADLCDATGKMDEAARWRKEREAAAKAPPAGEKK